MEDIAVNPESLNIIKLAHFVPMDNVDILESTKVDIVLNALFISEKMVDADQIKEVIAEKLGCIIDKAELVEVLETAAQQKLIIKNGIKYGLKEFTYQAISKRQEEIEIIKRRAIDKWHKCLSKKYGPLTSEEKEELQEKLIEYVTKICLLHGAESIRLLDEHSGEDNLKSLSEILDELIFANSKCAVIAQTEFIGFFSSEDQDYVRFLLSAIDRAFRYLITICDPAILKGIKVAIEGKIVYLDSSFVYRLLGLQGEHRYKVAREVVSLCREYNLKLVVSAMTLKELMRRIHFDSVVLKKYPVPTNLAAVGYNYITEENFISSYWEQTKKTGISVNDFIEKYKNIDILLTHERIEVEKQFPDFGDQFEARVKQILSLIFGREDHEKSDSAAEHDAYIIALIERLRAGQILNRFMESPCWVLTTDKFFMRLQVTEKDFKDLIPFAILPTQLINILRLVQPRDGKFNEVFLEVFSRTFIPMEPGLDFDNAGIQQILSRIALYKGYTPNLAEAVLSDQLFKRRYLHSQTEGEKEELIHEILVAKASEMELIINDQTQKITYYESEITDLKDELQSKDRAIETFQEELDKSKTETANTKEFYETLGKEIEDKKNKDEEQIIKLTQEVDRLKQSESERLEKEKRSRECLKKISLIVIYLLVSLLLIYLFNKIPNSQYLFRATILTIVTIGMIPVVRFVLDSKKAKFIATSIALIGTVLGVFYSLLAT